MSECSYDILPLILKKLLGDQDFFINIFRKSDKINSLWFESHAVDIVLHVPYIAGVEALSTTELLIYGTGLKGPNTTVFIEECPCSVVRVCDRAILCNVSIYKFMLRIEFMCGQNNFSLPATVTVKVNNTIASCKGCYESGKSTYLITIIATTQTCQNGYCHFTFEDRFTYYSGQELNSIIALDLTDESIRVAAYVVNTESRKIIFRMDKCAFLLIPWVSDQHLHMWRSLIKTF